jgi:competence protein ComFC
MAAINPQKIEGRWRSGQALDFHTVSSTHVGVDSAGRDIFETKRTELGELLYRLKYNSDASAATDIVATASNYLRTRVSYFDMIVPVPPSAVRPVQPVLLLANRIGIALGLPVDQCIAATRPATQIKAISDPDARKKALEGLYDVARDKTIGKRILLFDDLFRSGSTMNAITDLLLGPGGAATVDAMTITRTRVNR